MNLLRTCTAASLCLASLGLSSCLNAPDYPDTPAIDFKSLTLARNKPAQVGFTEIDTIKFALDFRDGDGDLGLSDEDIKVAPWNATTGGPNNRGYSYNFFIKTYKKAKGSGNFVEFINQGGRAGEYDGQFPRLDEVDARPAPIKGTLNFKHVLPLEGINYFPGDVLKFELSIMDRALHQSNTVMTTEVTLGQ